MKEFLVDVPICMQVWIRPELQRMTFEPIRQARPSILFLASDGGRNEEEWRKIEESRRIVENIDWECTIYKLYETKNNGLYAMGRKMQRFIFEHVDRVIIFEDDTLADPSYYRFCAELLERYKDDRRIQWIGGNCNLASGRYDEPSADYFFVQAQGYNTGYAIWKRSVQGFDSNYIFDDNSWLNDPYVLNLLQNISRELTFQERVIWKKRLSEIIHSKGASYDGHPLGSEFYGFLLGTLRNQLGILPRVNMVRQMGATDDAAHGIALEKLDKKSQEYYQMPVYSLDFPLKHPSYMIRDFTYERMILKEYTPLKNEYRKTITRLKRLYYGDGKAMLNSLCKRLTKKELEK